MGIKVVLPDIKEIKEINKAKRINTIILICGLLIGIMGICNGVINNEPTLALLGGGALGISLIPTIVKLFYKVYHGIRFVRYMIRKPKIFKTRRKE